MSEVSDTAIRVENVSKTFRLPHDKNTSIKSRLINFRSKGYEEQIALKDISFEVKKGDFFGIVGRNGSGKSTLLKLISGIYTPDSGVIQVDGKLVPFIELGVGFNPELTGRDNVFLNGALLGFSKTEMDKMYDEIVEFAELERFMDQKLKNYSSGMQVRLAFSIAIRAKADILVLDEVLAVGDEAFQRKCDEFFKTIKKDKTKTVILVTHNMESVKKYCNRAMLIRDGGIAIEGSTNDVTNQYTQDSYDQDSKPTKRKSTNKRVPYFKVTSEQDQVLGHKDTLIFNVEYEIADDTPVRTFISIMDEKRGFSILAVGAEAIAKKGRNKLTYNFPLKNYNDCDLLIMASLDEKDTKKRIASTSTNDSYRCAIRNTKSDNGLLRKDNPEVYGNWVGLEEYTYNLKDV